MAAVLEHCDPMPSAEQMFGCAEPGGACANDGNLTGGGHQWRPPGTSLGLVRLADRRLAGLFGFIAFPSLVPTLLMQAVGSY
jgi:hypothetical protein